MFLSRLPFCRFHCNGFCGACNCAQSTCCTIFPAFFVAVQYLKPPEYRTEFSFLLRVTDGGLPLKDVFEGDPHSLCYIPQVQPLQYCHWLSLYRSRSVC